MEDCPPDQDGRKQANRIAYLTGLYPAISHTFLLREVQALRAAGLTVITCSVNRPPASQLIGPEEIEAAASTYYLLAEMRRPTIVAAALGVAIMRPWGLLKVARCLRRSRTSGVRQKLRQIAYMIEAMVLARHLRQQGVTRIHNQLGMASASVSMYAAILADIPFSMSLHGPDDFFPAERPQLGRKIEAAEFVACISHFCRDQARQCSAPGDWRKLHLVRCGIDPARYPLTHERIPAQQILFLGRLVPVKGVPILLEAFAHLSRAMPGAVLNIAGDGPDRMTLEQTAQALGLGPKVHFVGALSQQAVAARMREADLFVLSSHDEGLPVVLMEAMASGLPVIASRIAGIPELIEEGVTGRMVASGDVAGLQAAMAAHFRDPEAAAAMAARARALVLRQHDMWVEGRRLAELLRTGPEREAIPRAAPNPTVG